jgi:alpha-2-macroglobulin
MTAYVVSGFGMAKSAGVDVRQDVLEKGESYLRNMLEQHQNMRSDLRAYVVYALMANGAADKQMLEDAWSDRSDMSTQGKAMLGLALHAGGDDGRARQIAEVLEKDASDSGFEAYWPDHYDYFMEFEFEDSAETTAYAVRLIAKVKPESAMLPKAAFWLVNHRDGGYFWASTKQTAMVIYGLTDYVRVSHEFEADFTADVFVNGKPVLSKRFTRADVSGAPATLHLDAGKLQPGANQIRIKKRGSGRLYWSARGEYYSADKRIFQNNKLSLNITRDYYRLTPQREKDQRITYKLEPLTGELHPGDVVAVKMTVTGGEWRYLLVEDPVASGMEFVLRDEGYEIKDRPDWWDSWFTRKEFHDDHAALFQTYFNNHQTFMYLLKAVNPGKFRVSPASVQPMYQPGVIATTDPLNVEVR